MKTANILVVDDEPNNFDVIEALLSATDRAKEMRLFYASSGQAVLERIDTFSPDVFLLDVMMPGMSGIEVCQRIKSMPQWRPVPIVMVTALTDKADLARCLSVGADDFISKPLNGVELRARVQAMLRIKRQYEDLQTLMQLREDMVNMVVHDLRNPLTSLFLDLNLLEYSEACVPSPKLDTMHQALQSLQLMVNDMLTLSRLETGKLVLHREVTDLVELGHTVVNNFEEIAVQKGQRLRCQVIANDAVTATVDRTLMHRTLDNLLSNAIKFSPARSEIVVTVAPCASAGIQLQVKDAGPGIPSELREQIFEKYEVGQRRLDVSQTGLGLAFCKLVVEAHEGTLCVKPNQPQGSIFEITLSGCRSECH